MKERASERGSERDRDRERARERENMVKAENLGAPDNNNDDGGGRLHSVLPSILQIDGVCEEILLFLRLRDYCQLSSCDTNLYTTLLRMKTKLLEHLKDREVLSILGVHHTLRDGMMKAQWNQQSRIVVAVVPKNTTHSPLPHPPLFPDHHHDAYDNDNVHTEEPEIQSADNYFCYNDDEDYLDGKGRHQKKNTLEELPDASIFSLFQRLYPELQHNDASTNTTTTTRTIRQQQGLLSGRGSRPQGDGKDEDSRFRMIQRLGSLLRYEGLAETMDGLHEVWWLQRLYGPDRYRCADAYYASELHATEQHLVPCHFCQYPLSPFHIRTRSFCADCLNERFLLKLACAQQPSPLCVYNDDDNAPSLPLPDKPRREAQPLSSSFLSTPFVERQQQQQNIAVLLHTQHGWSTERRFYWVARKSN